MSYADNVLRRRQEMERAFRERYNPMEDVVSALSDIDKEAFRREQIAAEEKRSVEKYGLEKERILAQTAKLNQDRSASEAALAAQREARKAEFEARAARQQEETRLKEQAEARKTGARTLYGMLTGRGQTARDVWGAIGAEEAQKAYAKRMPRALVEGTAEEVARMDEELAAIKERAPKKTPGGMTRDEIEEVAGAFGMTFDEALSLVRDMEQEEKDRLEKMGLTGARTEEALTRAELNRRKGVKGAPSAAQIAKETDEAFRRSLSIQFEKLKIKEKELKLGADSGFTLTPEVLKNIQEARIAAKAAQSGMNSLRALLKKYPDLESYTGPLDNMEAWARQKFGAQGQVQAEVRSTIDQVFQAFKRIQTGAAAGNQEMADLKQIMPSTTDMLPAIRGKMDASDNIVRQQVSYYDKLLEARDIRAGDEFAAGADIVAPAAPKKAPSASVTAAAAEAGVELE